MASIPNEVINEIRLNANIIDIVSSYINLEPKGKNYFGVCPFHNDHNPSLSVSKEKQIYTCFVCGATGNVFSFVQNYENVEFPEAVKIVADKIGYNLKYSPSSEKPNQKYITMIDLANKYFINNIKSKQGEKAKEYLIKERKLSKETIEEFNIGLALNNNNLCKLLLSKGYTEKEIIDYSLANKYEELSDLFKNRITFPISNDKGEVVGFSARIFDSSSDSKYINSRENSLFKKGNILFNYDKAKPEAIKCKEIILVEGQMDAIRVYSSGIKNVVASMGTALTKEHMELLKKLHSKVILCLDNDNAGEQSTLNNGEALIDYGLDVSVIRLSDYKDPDTYILEKGIESFKNLVKSPISFFDFKINFLKKNKDLNKAEDLASYINKIIDELNKSNDDVLKEITINNLVKNYNIDKKVLQSKIIVSNKPKITIKPKIKTKKEKNHKYAEALLSIMMNNTKYIKKYEKELNYIPDKLYKNIANDILAYFEVNKSFNIADFITYTKETPYHDKILEIIREVEPIYSEFDNYVKMIKIWTCESEIEELKNDLKNELDINKKEEIMNLIIKLKRRSEEENEETGK